MDRDRVLVLGGLGAAAAWPVADVVGANTWRSIPIEGSFEWIIGVAVIVLLVSILISYFARSFNRGVAVAAPLAVLFFSYAGLEPLFANAVNAVGLPNGQVILFGIVLIAATIMLFFSSKEVSSRRILLISPMLLLASSMTMAIIIAVKSPIKLSENISLPELTHKLNVYHLLFDAMARPEVLKKVLNLNVDDAASEFRSRGFIVPDNVLSVQPTTLESISTILNPEAKRFIGSELDINSSEVSRIFKYNGYSIVRYGEVFKFSACNGREDVCLSSSAPKLSEFDITMLKRTPLYTIQKKIITSMTSSKYLRKNLLAISDAKIVAPTYVFSYMVPPHPPFIFSKDCHSDQLDYSDFRAWRRSSIVRYGYGYNCVVKAALVAVDRIIARDPTAVIIVSGDHGTMFTQVGRAKDGWSPGALNERRPVFLAMRAPVSCSSQMARVKNLQEIYPALFQCLSRVVGAAGTPH